jgi:hypothetical protein
MFVYEVIVVIRAAVALRRVALVFMVRRLPTVHLNAW